MIPWTTRTLTLADLPFKKRLKRNNKGEVVYVRVSDDQTEINRVNNGATTKKDAILKTRSNLCCGMRAVMFLVVKMCYLEVLFTEAGVELETENVGPKMRILGVLQYIP